MAVRMVVFVYIAVVKIDLFFVNVKF